MLMWLTGFLIVPTLREWCGIPFMVIAAGLLTLWVRAYGPARGDAGRRETLRQLISVLAVEEAVVGAATGPLAGVHLAWNLVLGIHVAAWAPWLALAAGTALLALARLRSMPLEWVLPVRGRWRRIALAAAGLACLHVAGPCWILLFELWRFVDLGSSGPQLLAARLASGLLTSVVLLYSLAYVLRYGCSEQPAELDAGPSLSPLAS